jgi:hypothetical protein
MTNAKQINHHPIIKRIVLCGERQFGSTANSGAPITCEGCRNKLRAKMVAHRNVASGSSSKQEREFFEADAKRIEGMLALSKGGAA